MSAPMQPGDVRVNRANLLRRIGRVCFESGGEPGLPAPARVYVSPTVELHFDTLAEAAAWTARYDLHPRRWTSDGHLFVTATGLWEGVEIAVSSNQRQFAPADADPDDLSGERQTSTTCGYTSDGPCPWHAEPKSIEDVAPRGTDDAEGHTPKPADVAGYGHARGGNGFTEEPPSELTFTSTSEHDGALRRWDLTGPAGTASFVVAEAMGIQSASVFLRPPAGSDAETDTLAGRLARELHRDYLVVGDEQVIRAALEDWYGERLVGGRVMDRRTATPGVCANQMYSSIGGRCCAHCGQQIHHDGNGWRHIATKQAACAMEREAAEAEQGGA